MKFEPPLQKARLLRRYKRFLADIELDGVEVTAHVANPGAMTGLAEPGTEIWVQPATNPARKLRWSWIYAQTGTGLACVDTGMANRLVAEALAAGKIPWAGQPQIRPEQRYDANARIDFLLSGGGVPDTYVEVKSVTLAREAGCAEFPDTVTARGAKHLAALARRAAAGERAVLLYLVARNDCDRFAIAADIDPAYARAHAEARAAGVEIRVHKSKLTPDAAAFDICEIALDDKTA